MRQSTGEIMGTQKTRGILSLLTALLALVCGSFGVLGVGVGIAYSGAPSEYLVPLASIFAVTVLCLTLAFRHWRVGLAGWMRASSLALGIGLVVWGMYWLQRDLGDWFLHAPVLVLGLCLLGMVRQGARA